MVLLCAALYCLLVACAYGGGGGRLAGLRLVPVKSPQVTGAVHVRKHPMARMFERLTTIGEGGDTAPSALLDPDLIVQKMKFSKGIIDLGHS